LASSHVLSLLEEMRLLVRLEDLSCRIFFEIQDVWELDSVIELEIPASIEVVNDSLQMDNEGVGQLLDRQLLFKFNSLVAGLTLIITDYFS